MLVVNRIESQTSEKRISGDVSQVVLKLSWPILVATAAAIAIIIIGYLWSQTVLEQRARRDTHDAILTVLNTTGQAVIAWFGEREDEARLWASLDPVRLASLGLIDTPREDQAANLAALESVHATLDTLMAGKSFEGFTLMALDGEILASGPEKPSNEDDVWDVEIGRAHV